MAVASDATHAYRGYRLQTLYVLYRILNDVSGSHSFQPEGLEDLAILGADGIIREVVQVKAYSDNLTLSDFSPDKDNSFFYRVALKANEYSQLRITIAAFGAVGPELQNALAGNFSVLSQVANKLSRYGYIPENQAAELLSKIRLEHVSEHELKDQTYKLIASSMVGVDPEAAFDLLNLWLYSCAEHKQIIARRDVIEKVNQVGKFLAERATYHREWFTAVVPLSNDHSNSLDKRRADNLAAEFYQGMAARHEHVQAGVDVLRIEKLHAIADGFARATVVIVHGASGQGKSALAYRYLYEFFPDIWCFQVQAIDNRERALSVARALAGHADALGTPMVVYLDVTAGDEGWTELVRQLSAYDGIHVLVTIREEDWRRASISGSDLNFADIELTFDATEARHIYADLVRRHIPGHFVDFDDAWKRFGEHGPLLEFVHLITQGQALRDRLLQQVKRIEDEVGRSMRDPAELSLLRLVSIAGAFGARLHVAALAEQIGLRAPLRTFEVLENEYLVRRSDRGELVDGLHPVRSQVLVDLLTDPVITPWANAAQECLRFVHEPDLEAFLLYAFSRRSADRAALFAGLMEYEPRTWTGMAGGIHALTWLGLKEYVDSQSELIREAYGIAGPDGMVLLLDYDITDAVPGMRDEIGELIADTCSPEYARSIDALVRRQAEKTAVFTKTRQWIENRVSPLVAPSSDAEWSSLADVLFWLRYLEIDPHGLVEINDDLLDVAVNDLPIDVLADVIVGVTGSNGQYDTGWLDTHRTHLLDRFRDATQTVAVDDDGDLISAHFIVKWEVSPMDEQVEDHFHEQAMERINILRRLVPDRARYGCQGYGHRLLSILALDYDSTQKTGIPRSKLPSLRLTSVNSTFRGLALQPFRHSTWPDYEQDSLALRRTIVGILQQLERWLDSCFRKPAFAPHLGEGSFIDEATWEACRRNLSRLLVLPSCALDEWGFVDESSTSPRARESLAANAMLIGHGLAVGRYRGFRDAMRTFVDGVREFLKFGLPTLVLNSFSRQNRIGHTSGGQQEVTAFAASLGISENAPQLATWHLAIAVKAVHLMQREYRLLLEPFSNQHELERLESHEQRLFNRVWNMWYAFANEPNLVIQNAVIAIPERAAIIQGGLRKAMNRSLSERSNDQLELKILANEFELDGERTLWLSVNVTDPLDLFVGLENIIDGVRNAVVSVKPDGLRDYILDFLWTRVIVVPLIRGRILSASAWCFSRNSFLKGDLNSIYLLQQPVSPEALKNLGIERWELACLDAGLIVCQTIAELAMLAAHLRDLKRIQVDLDTEGYRILQNYINGLSPHISEILQNALDSQTRLVDIIREIPSKQVACRPRLLEVIDAINHVHEAALPTPDFNSRQELGLGECADWANRLEHVQETALLIYLYWVAETLDEYTLSKEHVSK